MTTPNSLQDRIRLPALLLLGAFCLLPVSASAQFNRPARQAPPVLVQPLPVQPMPFVQNAPAKFNAIEARKLLPETWLRFQRMPAVAELAALKHARAPGVLVLHLAAAPKAADCVRLAHGPKDWRVIMILPNTLRENDLRGLRHLPRSIEVAFPGLPAVQTAALLQPLRRATPSTMSNAVCGHVIRR